MHVVPHDGQGTCFGTGRMFRWNDHPIFLLLVVMSCLVYLQAVIPSPWHVDEGNDRLLVIWRSRRWVLCTGQLQSPRNKRSLRDHTPPPCASSWGPTVPNCDDDMDVRIICIWYPTVQPRAQDKVWHQWPKKKSHVGIRLTWKVHIITNLPSRATAHGAGGLAISARDSWFGIPKFFYRTPSPGERQQSTDARGGAGSIFSKRVPQSPPIRPFVSSLAKLVLNAPLITRSAPSESSFTHEPEKKV